MNSITIVLYIGFTCCCVINAQNDASSSSSDRQCVTPGGKPGECVGLHACPALRLMLLTPPVSNKTIQFVRNSKCNGVTRYSVCCDLNSISKQVPGGNCAATMSALLPDPTSECCGHDARLIDKIAGGKPTAVDQYPWLVLIEYLKDDIISPLCAGVLISGKYVLTAAQCLVAPRLSDVKPVNVCLGEYDTSNEGPDCMIVQGNGKDCTDGAIRIPIEKTIPHPEFKSIVKRHDIGLIRMKEMAPYTDFIRPICLPTFNIKLKAAPFKLTIAGWGAHSADEFHISSTKFHADVPYVNLEQCQEAYKAVNSKHEIWKGQICAGGQKGIDSCSGDSGGPLMFENGRTYEIVGVISFGPVSCGLENNPTVHTNVYEYNDWITSNIAP